jgi:hypothetical protein
MPLFQIYGTEGKAVQGLEGKWETKVLGKETNHYIKSSGKIINDSKTTCRINKENAVFKFQQENPGKESGIVFRIPYAWIGSRYLIRRFSEKADMAGITPPYASNEFLKNLTYEDSFKGCPLKIGACLDLDVIPANSRLEWFPTESEKITFIFKQNCRVAAGRFQKFLYNPPFDISTLPDWSKMISSAKKQGPIEFAPPAFFKVYPTEKGTEAIAVECFYEKVWDKKKKLTKENKTSEKTDDIACVKEGANVIIKTPYWQVTHDGTKGGVPSKIIFPQGLNENILKAPIASYIVDKTDKNFAESDFENPEIKIDKSKKGVIKLVVTGKLGNSGVPFTTEYIYDKGGLRRNLTLGFDKKPMEIKTLGVARIETTPSLDYAKYKPCLTRYTKAVFPGPPVTQGTRLYLGVMGLYRQNGEGIDFTPASDIWKWYVLGENKGFFAIKGNNANPMIVAEALHVNKSIKVDKEISYEHYIGLPEAKDPAPRKWRPCGISECRWVTTNDNVVKTFADSGINVAISPGGSVGFGCYYKQLPPIFLETAAKLKKNGISPLPFFAPTCFVKKCKEVNENKDKWAMGSYKDGKFQPSWCGTYLMGCYESKGLVDFMKKGYANVMKYYPNNGIYCDFIYPMGPCKNPAHAKTPHIAMDGLLEFCDWLRYDLLKKDQIFYAHTGYCPVYNVERYCDLAFTWEEMNYWYSNENRPVSLERVSECGVQTSNIQRAMDPHPIFSWQKRNGEPLGMTRIRNLPEDTRAVITRMALNGVFPILHTGMISPVSEKDLLDKSKDFLKLYKAFKEVELSEYHFMDWKKQNVALTESPYIRMAVYFKDKSALIIIGVPESVKKQKFNWKISEAFLKELGLTGNLTIKNSTTGESAQSTATQLSRKGIDAELEGFDFAVMELKKN